MGLYTKFHDVYRPEALFGLLLCFFMLACSEDNKLRTVEVFRVAVLPDQTEAQLRSKYQPLLDHLKSHADINAELFVPESYDQLLLWFNNKKIDMALFGGVTYVKAHQQSKAMPLVMRDVDGRFRSVALVHASNPANNLHDLKNATLAFGSRLSTSGHFMPRYFFQQNKIKPEKFFSQIKYSGAHDLTAEWVRDGKIDLGVSNSGIVNEMFSDGRLSKEKVKVIWESPPFADYVWAIQADINKQQIITIRDAFLHMNQNAEDKILLQGLGANYYIPSEHDDFSRLEQVVMEMQRQKIVQ